MQLIHSHIVVISFLPLSSSLCLPLLSQEASLSVWLYYSDNTVAPLALYDPKDYNLNASTFDEKVCSVTQTQRWPVIVAEGEGYGELLRVEMTIGETCQKTKRKSVIASSTVYVKVATNTTTTFYCYYYYY